MIAVSPPAAAYVPGLPCGPQCTVCRQPVPMVEMLNPLEAQAKRDLYESRRPLWREVNQIPPGAWRSAGKQA